MTGKWEFDESGIPEFVCECEYCLGFQDDIPEECANNELPTSEWNIAPNYIGVGSELVEVNQNGHYPNHDRPNRYRNCERNVTMRITIEVIDAIELPHSDNLIDCTRIQLLGGGTITIRNSSIVNIER